MMKSIKNLNILPRWVILSLDLFILVFGYIFATLVRFNLALEYADRWLSPTKVITYVGVYLLCALYFKPHASIIRYTHKEDVISILKTVFLADFILAGLNLYVKTYYPPNYVIPFSILTIGAFVNAALLTGYRFVIKEFFESTVSKFVKKTSVVIFGAGETGRLAGRIMQERNSHYVLKFFLDDDSGIEGSKIHGVPVYKPPKDLSNLLESAKIEEVIIAVQNLSLEKRDWLVDQCLNLNIHIKEVPNAQKWVGGHLSEKQFKEVRIEDLLGRNPISLTSDGSVNTFSGKVVLVTGAAGSIGSEICRQLMRGDVEKLVALDIGESALYDLNQELKRTFKNLNNIDIQLCDITKLGPLRMVFDSFKPEIVFHAAAYKHVPIIENQPMQGIETNISGTKNLADLATAYEVEKFIMVSTDKAVNPTNIMGATKRAAEMYCQSLNDTSPVEFITTRFGNVLGSNGSIIPLITNQIREGGPITITHPEITRYFMTIPEACSLVLEAGAMGEGGEIFVFDMGKPVKILELAQKMIKLAGLTEGEDVEIEFIGLRPGEKLYEEVLSNLEGLKNTHHPKIRIAKKVHYDFEMVTVMIESILTSLDNPDEMETVRRLKSLVPEFISKVSRFEVLDNTKPIQS